MKRVYRRVSEVVYQELIKKLEGSSFVEHQGEQYAKGCTRLELIVGFYGLAEELIAAYFKNNRYYVLEELL